MKLSNRHKALDALLSALKASATDFNPFHDKEDGRFAEADKGGSGFNTLGEKLDEIKTKEAVSKYKKEPNGEMSESDIAFLGSEIPNVKGYEALKALMGKKTGHVKCAFHRNDLGDITVAWGNDNGGLCHIIKKHGAELGSEDKVGKFIRGLAETIQKGILKYEDKTNNFLITDSSRKVVIRPKISNNKILWMVSAYGSYT